MTRLHHLAASAWVVATTPYRAIRSWWEPIPPEGQVAVVGLALLGVGLQAGVVGLAVPGLILTAIGMGFNLRRGP